MAPLTMPHLHLSRSATKQASCLGRVSRAAALPRIAALPLSRPGFAPGRLASSDSRAPAPDPRPESNSRPRTLHEWLAGRQAATSGPDLDLLWLRDACQCPRCVSPHSGQKTFATTQLPDNPLPESAGWGPDGSLRVVWESDELSSGGGAAHESVYPPGLLERAGEGAPARRIPRTLWDRAAYEGVLDSCRISYGDWLAAGERFWDAFAQLHRTGLVFVHDVPESETSVEEVGRRIGRLQDTFYGLTWDVVSKPAAENVAYTSTFLCLHQDLLYHRDCPRIQLLHCISNECDGGDSLFSDGARAAMELQARDEASYAVLAGDSARYHYDRNGHHYQSALPVIRQAPGSRYVPSVWWSPPFQAPFPPGTAPRRWQPAARAFERTLAAPENMFRYKMRPGECVVFDNWRVLHGRRRFDTSQGRRWLKGAYVADQVFAGRTVKLMDRFATHWEPMGDRDMAALEEAQVVALAAARRRL